MKTIAVIFGIALIIVAVIYFMVPAELLPGFFPGHETGLARIRVKHGVLSGGLGVILLAGAWMMGRK